MILAPKLAEDLHACFIARTTKPYEGRFAFAVGGRWYCPACGVEMRESEGAIRCPQCDRWLNEFVIALIERHPHR
jgi:rubrerythrin